MYGLPYARQASLGLFALLYACAEPETQPVSETPVESEAPVESDDVTDVPSDEEADDASVPESDDPSVDPWWEEEAGDADGDGVTAADGDCDDTDPDVYPGQLDACNGRDDDCDGRIDEDFGGDANEPNDGAAFEVGYLGTEGEELLYGYVHPASDVDRYVFYVEDGTWSYFDIEVWLYGVPADADYALELHWVADSDGDPRGLVASSDSVGLGGYELINYGGLATRDDSGWYEVVVRSELGSSCHAPYTAQILVGGW